MPEVTSSQTGRIIVLSLLVCGFLAFVVVLFNTSTTNTPGSRRVRLQGRYKTEKEIISPVYHYHHLPLMPLDLKTRYEKKRLLVLHGRRRLQARTSILKPFRSDNGQATDESPVEEKRDYIPLNGDDQKLDFHCNTCSLVANSGYISHSSLGREIDQSECVFRMDAAPTQGYERDVGRKTTVRVVSYTSLSELASKAETLVAIKPSATHLLFHGPEHVFTTRPLQKYLRRLTEARPDVQLYRMGRPLENEADFEFLKHSGQSRNSSSEFSTNMYALLAMKDVCADIKVYGMLPRNFCRDNPDNKVRFNYYKDPVLEECAMYDFHENMESGGQPLRAEKHVFEVWAAKHNIEFVHPVWN